MSTKNTDKNTESSKSRRLRNLIPWKPGQSGNPSGRPFGQRNYKTIYQEALKKVAEETGYSMQEIEEAMTVKAIEKSIKGDFFFYKEVHDRVHGKAKETLDVTSGGRSLTSLIALTHGSHTRGAGSTRRTATPRKNKK